MRSATLHETLVLTIPQCDFRRKYLNFKGLKWAMQDLNLRPPACRAGVISYRKWVVKR